MTITVDIQYAAAEDLLPDEAKINNWVQTALKDLQENAELTVRIVNEAEATELNERWRNTKGPTSVLSFPSDNIQGIVPDLLGDIIICASLVKSEAIQQKKEYFSHCAHLIVHGILHLMGYLHNEEHDAKKMEELEIEILKKLDIPSPYLNIDD